MNTVKIFGAGSIGNHLAYACRQKDWAVTLSDVDPKALERTQNDIYPSRYGKWDSTIELMALGEQNDTKAYDVVIIGTPPDSHIQIALETLKKTPPKVLLIEKPLCTPSLEGCDDLVKAAKDAGTYVAVGYNHTTTQNTQVIEKLLNEKSLGKVETISAEFREYWGGIFAAHPWLAGPQDSYLGFSRRGGGACGEHSHAINIWQHFAHAAGQGRVSEVTALLDMVQTDGLNYDKLCQIHVKTEKGLVGTIVQDVVTEPSEKYVRIQGDKGHAEWFVNYEKNVDAVRFRQDSKIEEVKIPKTRPDDFKYEIDWVEKILAKRADGCPLSLERGLETMMVIAAAYLSHQKKRTVRIDYESGYHVRSLHIE